jgi:serine/threonine protein kinase
MVSGTVPFKAQSMRELHEVILNGDWCFPDHMAGLLSVEVKDLITQMLIVNPNKRITIPDILSHPWITEVSFDVFDETSGTLDNGMTRDEMMSSFNHDTP